jgi:hypothetical protein
MFREVALEHVPKLQESTPVLGTGHPTSRNSFRVWRRLSRQPPSAGHSVRRLIAMPRAARQPRWGVPWRIFYRSKQQKARVERRLIFAGLLWQSGPLIPFNQGQRTPACQAELTRILTASKLVSSGAAGFPSETQPQHFTPLFVAWQGRPSDFRNTKRQRKAANGSCCSNATGNSGKFGTVSRDFPASRLR